MEESNLHYRVEMCRAFWFLWKLVEQRRLIEKHWAFSSKQHVDLSEDQSQPRWHQMRHNQWENLRRKKRRNPWSTPIIKLFFITARFIFIRWSRGWSWGIRWWCTRWWIRLCSRSHRIIWMMCWLLFTRSTIRFRRVMGHCNLYQRTEILHRLNLFDWNKPFSRCSSW